MSASDEVESGPFALPIDVIDELTARVNKVSGLIYMMAAAAHGPAVPKEAGSNACWAITDLLDEVKALAMTKAPQP